MHLSTQSLRIFLAVVEQGSLTKAARSLYMSQPSVSVHVRGLETSLSAQLIERSTTGVTPTAAGLALADRARQVLAIIDDIDVDVAAAQGIADRRLALAATTTLGNSFVPRLLAGFARDGEALGSIRVELRVGHAEQVIRWVLDREVSVGVCAGPVDHQQLHTDSLLDEALVLAAAPSHPLATRQADGHQLTPADLADQRFLMREIGSATRAEQDRALAMWGARAAAQWTIWGTEGARECVRSGLGISLISEHVVAPDLASGDLVALELHPAPPRRPVTLVRLAGASLRPLEADLVALLTRLHDWPGA